jgi:hypothetical protein
MLIMVELAHNSVLQRGGIRTYQCFTKGACSSLHLCHRNVYMLNVRALSKRAGHSISIAPACAAPGPYRACTALAPCSVACGLRRAAAAESLAASLRQPTDLGMGGKLSAATEGPFETPTAAEHWQVGVGGSRRGSRLSLMQQDGICTRAPAPL